jgi:retron-type reverse transcriptase
MGMVARRVVDRKVLGLIKGWLGCAVEEDGRRWKPSRGTPQGGVISPLLANIYLHTVDATWEQRGYTKRSGPNVQMVMCHWLNTRPMTRSKVYPAIRGSVAM